MQEYFDSLAVDLTCRLRGEEVFTANFQGEDSEFIRFNHGDVRQAGSVVQRMMHVDLIDGRRHAAAETTLSGDASADQARLGAIVRSLRERLSFLPEDPYLSYATEVRSSERHGEARLPEPGASLDAIRSACDGRDMVGVYAAGEIATGFANSLGQRNWNDTRNYNLDWSFYHAQDKAVKASYAGLEWDEATLNRKVDLAARQLEALARTPATVVPGPYRAYLAPAAVYDIVGLLGWGGFGLKSHRTRQTPLLRMLAGDASLAESVTISENTAGGLAPDFESAGFLRPDAVTLIQDGRYRDCLVSPRSAMEYGVPTNGASAEESPESVELAAGSLATEDALSELGSGVYIGNVHYLNYSDRSACRTTGMTRFATFLVERGEIVAPLNVMRFDETIYRILGENLVALTAERELILDPGTYFGRSTESGRMPGALVEDFTFTL